MICACPETEKPKNPNSNVRGLVCEEPPRLPTVICIIAYGMSHFTRNLNCYAGKGEEGRARICVPPLPSLPAAAEETPLLPARAPSRSSPPHTSSVFED
ncbi:hypothetical protein L596_002391 [Steinernema carpocapsae]|uniref:Uncharacterized protein n=1 Tax=Steinernema carpocapsae TaxID=34508 RepID=A0A4U8UP18_STECR|nr:hypothetical protein L596_002391 [Steinernema carpocapsae]